MTIKITKESKTCFRCKKIIGINDKYVSLITTDRQEIIESVHFHFPNCWHEFNEDKLHDELFKYARYGEKLLGGMLGNKTIQV